MFIIKSPKDKEHPFTQISNSLIYDNRLSLKSKGLLLFLLSKPPSWCFNFRDILRLNKDKIESIRSSIHELISTGYISLHQSHRPNGKFDYFNYTVFETPIKLISIKTTSQPHTDFTDTVKADTVKADTVETYAVNNKIKIKIKKEVTTTKPTKVVNTTAVVSPEYIKKKKEFIAYSKALGVFNQESLIRKYGLDFLYGNVYSFAKGIKNSSNPTGCLVTSIKENWISKPCPADFPLLLPFDSTCNKCGVLFHYLDYRPIQKICPKCKNKGK